MDMQTSNASASYALWTGIATWVINVMGCCVGMIPLVGILCIPMGLGALMTSVAAVAFGFQGRAQAKQTGVGGGEATAGMVLGLVNLALSLGLFAVTLLLGGLTALMALMGGQ